MVQWLRLHTSNARGVGSIPVWENKIPHTAQRGLKSKTKNKNRLSSCLSGKRKKIFCWLHWLLLCEEDFWSWTQASWWNFCTDTVELLFAPQSRAATWSSKGQTKPPLLLLCLYKHEKYSSSVVSRKGKYLSLIRPCHWREFCNKKGNISQADWWSKSLMTRITSLRLKLILSEPYAHYIIIALF